MPKDPRLPRGQTNGIADECWFRAPVREALLSNNAYAVEFYVKNDFKKKIQLSLFDSLLANAAVSKIAGEEAKLKITYERKPTDQDIYVLLNRSDVNDFEFLVAYRYAISYLNHLEIYCIDDQSGLGADEIHVTMKADNMATNCLDFKDEDF